MWAVTGYYYSFEEPIIWNVYDYLDTSSWGSKGYSLTRWKVNWWIFPQIRSSPSLPHVVKSNSTLLVTQAKALALSFSHTQHSIHQQTLLAILLNCIYPIHATSPVSGNNPPIGLLSSSLPPCDTPCSRVSLFKHKLVHVTFGSKPSYGFPSHSEQIQSPAKVVKAPCDLVLVLWPSSCHSLPHSPSTSL